MLTTEYILERLSSVHRELSSKSISDPGRPYIFERRGEIAPNLSVGLLYAFPQGIIADTMMNPEVGLPSAIPVRGSFFYRGSVRGESVAKKKALLEEALDTISAHDFLQAQGRESFPSLKVLPESTLNRAAALARGN